MALALAAMLWFGRGTTFSGDEMVWVVTSPGLDLDTALQPHAGHLLLVSRLAYAPLLDLFGLDYLPYRVLTGLSVCLTVGLLFTYIRRRVPDAVAIVPCVVLLFFGSDHLHTLQGNGFTICFSLAMGLLALLAIEREDLLGDAVAAVALTVAVATYAVGIPFVAGALVSLLVGRRWRRLWVPAVPTVLYLGWFAWSTTTETADPGGQVALSDLAEIPRWAFEASGAALYALIGSGFQSDAGDALDLIDPVAALLAVLLVGAVVACVLRGRAGKGLLVALAIGLSLWGMQALVSETGGRLPDDARYLYPGAVACVLILAEAARGVEWRTWMLAPVYVLGAIGLAANFVLLERNGDFYRERALLARGYAGVVRSVADTRVKEGTAEQRGDLDRLVTEQMGAAIAMADVPYGDFGIGGEELLAAPEEVREAIDGAYLGAQQMKLLPAPANLARGCRRVPSTEGVTVATLGPRGATLGSESGVPDLFAGRFADVPSQRLGSIRPGGSVRVEMLPDREAEAFPWRVAAPRGDLTICLP